MLRSIEPQAWDNAEDTVGYHTEHPYTGQEYDPDTFELIPSGWDHEHCAVCWVRIVEGNEYWKNDGPDEVELCLGCFDRIKDQLTVAGAD